MEQTRTLFYISVKDNNGETYFFVTDPNYTDLPISVSKNFEECQFSTNSYMEGRVKRMKRINCQDHDGKGIRYHKPLISIDKDTIKIHEVEIVHKD